MPLPRMTLRVDLKGNDETQEVDALNPDMIRYETEARKLGLSQDPQVAPFTWLAFLAWAALTREKRYSDPWSKFKLEDCLAVESDSDEENVDPTRAAGEYDSPSSSQELSPEPPWSGSST